MSSSVLSRACLVFLAWVASPAMAHVSSAPRSDVCNISVLPPEVRNILAIKFAGWRPKQLRDLIAEDQKLWLRGPQSSFCPGIATGHFESASYDSYAVLLLRESEPSRGYKVVVFSKRTEAPEPYFSNVLGSADTDADSSMVISKTTPGTFTDLKSGESVRTTMDGLIVEWLEKAAVLYYWSPRHWNRILISD